MNVVLIPSVAGGIGHISRAATLARMLQRLDPTVNVEYLLDTERLRAFNIDAASRTGYRVNLLPPRPRDAREAIVRHCLGHADVIIDDTVRYLVPLRQSVPRAAWISIPLYPMGDELYMDWPFLDHTDGIIWAYAPVLDFPPELEIHGSKVLRTGPFLELDDVAGRDAARARLGFAPDEQLVVYAPRGMPFGREFGERVLAGVFGAVEALREQHQRLRLVLLAVSNRAELCVPGIPTELPEWVRVVGVVPPAESLIYLCAADIAVAEGTSTTHEAAALGIPFVMIPGPISETWLLGTRLGDHQAAHILWIERVTPTSVASIFKEILTQSSKRDAMTARAQALVTGGGGVAAAARLVLDAAVARRNGHAGHGRKRT